MSVLRQSEFVNSVRGQAGGYVLARPPEKIALQKSWLHSEAGCSSRDSATNRRSRTNMYSFDGLLGPVALAFVQHAIDLVLAGITLKDLLRKESEVSKLVALRAIKKG